MLPADRLKERARQLGFVAVGVAAAAEEREARFVFHERIALGIYDGLPWFHHERADRATDATRSLPGAASVITLAAPYKTSYRPQFADGDPAGLRGRIARYAWGRDYHRVLEKKLKSLAHFIEAECEEQHEVACKERDSEEQAHERASGRVERSVRSRGLVDYGPLAERAYAARAGVGWFGKHTNLLLPGFGSWVLLAELVTTVAFVPDQPLAKSCGACARCQAACPTGAISGPYVVDNRRCISFQTIENRGWIPRELRPLIGDWVFGCDLCQDACPVGREGFSQAVPAAQPVPPRLGEGQERSQGATLPEFVPRLLDEALPELTALLRLSEEQFRERFQGRAIMRAKRAGLARNACVVLGNLGDRSAVPALGLALGSDPSSIVRGHAAWALGRLGGNEARASLERALASEQDAAVRDEIAAALGGAVPPADGRGVLTRPDAWLAGPWRKETA